MSSGGIDLQSNAKGGMWVGLREFDLTCNQWSCHTKGTYSLLVKCFNCNAEGVGHFTRGHVASTSRCPDCDTLEMRVDRTAT